MSCDNSDGRQRHAIRDGSVCCGLVPIGGGLCCGCDQWELASFGLSQSFMISRVNPTLYRDENLDARLVDRSALLDGLGMVCEPVRNRTAANSTVPGLP